MQTKERTSIDVGVHVEPDCGEIIVECWSGLIEKQVSQSPSNSLQGSEWEREVADHHKDLNSADAKLGLGIFVCGMSNYTGR